MKVLKNDIRSIKPGTTTTFTVDHPRYINSVKTMASHLNTQEPELRKRFVCKSDYKRCRVSVTAFAI